jgi:low temperature requirement protein LtrA
VPTAAVSPPIPGSSTSVAQWLELFFDLVVVAAVAVVTDGLLEDQTMHGLGLAALAYGAIWMSWISIVLYANVAEGNVKTLSVVVAMFLIALMAASPPGHAEGRANAFGIGFLVVRSIAARASLQTGRLLTSWPLLQFGGLALPWIVGLFVPGPAKYLLWGAALAGDLGLLALRGSDPVRAVAAMQARWAKARARSQGGSGGHRGEGGRDKLGQLPLRLVEADVDVEHLDERLSLFMIIVLGEVVSQIVVAASSTTWDGGTARGLLPSFCVLVGLWWLTFSHGFSAAPHQRLANLPPRFGLPMHLVSTFGIVLLAAGFGEIAHHPDDRIGSILRWIMCAGLAGHFLVAAVVGATAHAPLRWQVGWGVPGVILPLVVALVGGSLPNSVVIDLLLLTVLWAVAYGFGDKRRTTGSPAAGAVDQPPVIG